MCLFHEMQGVIACQLQAFLFQFPAIRQVLLGRGNGIFENTYLLLTEFSEVS